MVSKGDERRIFQRKLTDLTERMLTELLTAHNVPARVAGGTIHVDLYGLRAECLTANYNQHPDAVVLQIDVRLWTSLVPDYPILTPLAGTGQSWPAAVHKALTDWFHRIFEPVRAALGFRPDQPAYEMAATTTGTAEFTTWDVFEGPIEIVAQGAEGRAMLERAVGEQQRFPLVLDALTRAVGDRPDRALHWVKIFLARNHDGSRVTECQIDNIDWPDDLDKLLAFRWPEQPGYMAIKYFAVLRRKD